MIATDPGLASPWFAHTKKAPPQPELQGGKVIRDTCAAGGGRGLPAHVLGLKLAPLETVPKKISCRGEF